MQRKIAKWVIWYMVAMMFIIGITPKVYAGLSPSQVMSLSQTERQSDLQKIQKVLESKMIRERLEALGFTPGEIRTRLSQLTGEQVHQLALRLDEMNVGGNGGEVVIIVLLIAILVVLIIYLSGHKVVIK